MDNFGILKIIYFTIQNENNLLKHLHEDYHQIL